MTITKLVLIALMNLTQNDALAGDDWLCTQEASQRRSNSILACGVATAKDESAARAKAFDAAMDEFHRVCDNSVDCKDHEFQVMPQRTECSNTNSGEKCYRLVQVYIGHKFMPLKRIKTVVASAAVEVRHEVSKLKGFVLKKGMTKKQVVSAFGMPYKIAHYGNDLFFYNDKNLCSDLDSICSISFVDNKVYNTNNVDVTFLEL